MTRRLKRAAFVSALLLVLASTVACGPSGAFGDDDNNNPGPGVFAPQFQLPTDGSTVNTVMTLEVQGKDVVSASFSVNGLTLSIVTQAPFQWTLDPADFVLGDYTLTVVGADSFGRTESSTSDVTLERAVPIQDIIDALDNLTPSHWYEIPNSRLRAVGWNDSSDPRGPLARVMQGESGAAYDTKRDQLIVFGGGADYSGNEVYIFDLATAAWSRVTDPSAFFPGDEDNASLSKTHPDGRPFSRRTYDYIEYVPDPVDRLFVGGGAVLYSPGPIVIDTQTYTFDLDTFAWATGTQDTPSAGVGSVAAVAADGRIWQQGGGIFGAFSDFDLGSDTATTHALFNGVFESGATAAIDPGRELFVTIGNGITWTFDLTDPTARATQLTTTGPTQIESVRGAGLAYHPGSGKMVAWSGGKSAHTLDLDTGEWTTVPSTGTVDPGPQTPLGTFGRWRYVPSKDIFIVVTSVDLNVFAYKLP